MNGLQGLDPSLVQLISRAEEFHGHLGPFLILGLKLGLTGIKVLSVERGDPNLLVAAKLEYRVPFSCVLDGIQISTGCTFGNKRLKLINTPGISSTFERDGKFLEIEVPKEIIGEIERSIKDSGGYGYSLERIAYKVAATDCRHLFLLKVNSAGEGN